MKIRTVLRRACWIGAVLFLAIQLVPYGREHSNPQALREPAWDSPRTRALARRACFDCHSNETNWPWYSRVAPASWLLQRDVEDGRKHLNFSEWNRPQKHAEEADDELREGEMPPWFYPPLHAGARLSEQDKKALIEGLERTFKPSQPGKPAGKQ